MNCVCGHGVLLDEHPWNGREWGACHRCRVCDRTAKEHNGDHEYRRCRCNKYIAHQIEGATA